MITNGSRYERAAKQFVQSHIYSKFGYPVLTGEAPNLKIRLESREATFMLASLSPIDQAPQLQEYYVKDTENIQFLAFKFMADPNRWWEIANANPQIWYPLDVPPGTYIQIPTDIT